MDNLAPPTPAPMPAEPLFCESLPQLPRAFDSTMLGLLKTCPRKFKYVIIDGLQPPGFAAHLAFGAAYHSALEQFDKTLALTGDRGEATRVATRFALSYGHRDGAGQFFPYDAAFTRESTKTRETLVQAVIWYLDHFKDDPAKTLILSNGEPAVELSFKINLTDFPTPDGVPFILCGHLDRVVTLDDRIWWTDKKSTKSQLNARFFAQFTPNNQMSLYHAAAQIILGEPAFGGLIDAVQLGVNFARFARHPIRRTPGQQEEWYRDTKLWINLAIQYAADEYWPQNDKSCSDFGGCPFIPICGRDPKVRQGFLEHAGFIERRWNPLESR